MDYIFRRKLYDYSDPPPMHLWDEIEAKRSRGKVVPLWRSQSWLLWVVLILGTSLAVTQFFRPDAPKSLDSFPVPVQLADAPLLAHPSPLLSADPDLGAAAPKTPVPQVKKKPRPEGVVLQPLPAQPPNLSFPAHRLSLPTASRVAQPLPPVDLTGGFRRGALPVKPECVDFGPGKFRFFVDAGFSADLPLRNLEAKGDYASEYVASRNATETARFSYSGGLRVSLLTPWGLALRTGINYSQINERFDFTYRGEETVTITTIYDAEGNIIGTDTLRSGGEQRVVSNNRLRMLDIPLLLGYEKRLGRWNLGANAGTYINLLFAAEGEFLSPEMEPVPFSSGQAESLPAFRNRIGLGLYGSIQVGYLLNPKLQLLFEPHFKYFPQPATIDQYEAEQRIANLGLFLGLRQEF